MQRILTALVLLALVVSPAVDAAGDAGPAVDSSAAALATPESGARGDREGTRTGLPEADPAASDLTLDSPETVMASGCSVSFDCGDGTTASCTGTTCAAFTLAVPAFVKCDGNKYFCPNMCFVDVRCTPTGTLFCSSNVGDCQEGSDWVRCDGTTIDCPQYPFID